MALPQAQLGQIPMMNLGGYIPAPAERLSPYERALTAFLQGAAGTAAGNLVDKYVPNPNEVAARSDRARQLSLEQQRVNISREGNEAADRRWTAEQKATAERWAKEFARQRGLDVEKGFLDSEKLRLDRQGFASEDSYRRGTLGIGEQNARTNAEEARNRGTVGASTARVNNANAATQEAMNDRTRGAARADADRDAALRTPAEPERATSQRLADWLAERAINNYILPEPGVSEAFGGAADALEGVAPYLAPTGAPYRAAVKKVGGAMPEVTTQSLEEVAPYLAPVGMPFISLMEKLHSNYLQ